MSIHNINLTIRAAIDDGEWELYKYTPNLGANIFFTIMFFLLFFLQILRQILVYRKYSKYVDRLTDANQSLESWPQTTYEDPVTRSENQSNKSLVNSGNDEINSKAMINPKQLKKVFIRYVCCFIPFLIGNLCEAVGYIGRVGSHSDKDSVPYYIIQSLLTLIGPAFMAATIYMLFGRLVVLLNSEKYCPVKVKFLTPIFVAGDVISLLVQSGGAGMSASGDSDKVNTSLWIVVGGLIIQVIFFALFIIMEIRFVYMMNKEPTPTSIEMRHSPSKIENWKAVNILFIVSSLLIMVRSVFRVVEYAEGSNGATWTSETYLLVLDSTAITISSILFVVFCPLKAILALYLNQQNIKEFPH